jgi:hypothetical protein
MWKIFKFGYKFLSGYKELLVLIARPLTISFPFVTHTHVNFSYQETRAVNYKFVLYSFDYQKSHVTYCLKDP